MRILSLTISFAFLLVGVSGHCQAQTPVVLDTNPPPAAATTSPVKSSGTANARYNKFTDTTSSSSASIALKIGESGWGSLRAGFSSKGNAVVKPAEIILSIFTAVKDRSFVDKPDATVFADGEKLFDGKAKITDARTNGNEVYVSFDISIALSDFEKIVKAEKFGVSVGPRAWIILKDRFSNWGDLLGLF